jgi:hypothetical protein
MGRTLREIANGSAPPARVPRAPFVWRWGRLWRLRLLAAVAAYPAALWLLQTHGAAGDAPLFAALVWLPALQLVFGTLAVAHGRAAEGWSKVPWSTWLGVPLLLLLADAAALVAMALFASGVRPGHFP